MLEDPSLDAARGVALDVRALYEVLEERLNGRTWSLHELMLGFSNDVGRIGRLILADDGTWGIDGDPHVELQHKLAESVWWAFVLADRLGIDLDHAYGVTMTTIRDGLEAAIARSAPAADRPTSPAPTPSDPGGPIVRTTTPTQHLHAADDPELVRAPAAHVVAVLGSGAPGTDEFYRKQRLVGDIARTLRGGGVEPVIEIRYWYPEGASPTGIADFYSVNPVTALRYRVMATIPESTTAEELADARARTASGSDSPADVVELVTTPEQDVVQVMHHGPFAEEFGTLDRLGRFAASHGLHRSGPHHELHLDAFTRSTPQNTLRTILRDPVA